MSIKRIIIGCLLGVLCSGYAMAEYATVSCSGSALNIRSSATSNVDNIIERVPCGQRIEVVEKSATWTKVRYNGFTGYVMTKYLKFEAIRYAEITLQNGGKSLNMRSAANDDAPIVALVPANARVRILNSDPIWSEIDYNGKTGWVMTKYLVSLKKQSVQLKKTQRVYVNSAGGLMLRANADRESSVYQTIPDGAEVTIKRFGETWSQVSYKGQSGYVLSEYLSEERVSGSTSSSSNQASTTVAKDLEPKDAAGEMAFSYGLMSAVNSVMPYNYPYTDMRSIGMLDFQIHFYVKPWIRIGGKLTFEMPYETIDIEDPDVNGMTKNIHYPNFSIMPSIQFSYINTKWVRLYSGADLGVYLRKNYYGGKIQAGFAWNVTPVGVSVGRNLIGILEVNVGSDSWLKLGIGKRF
ncbi:MAG: SH3 domain-containing protein [Paludibacteraceae bacterium]